MSPRDFTSDEAWLGGAGVVVMQHHLVWFSETNNKQEDVHVQYGFMATRPDG